MLKKPIFFNLFEMNNRTGDTHGLWRHPDSRHHEYNDINFWVTIARKIEEGGFTALFLGDFFGASDVYKGSSETTIRHAMQFPSNDPSLLIPSMAQATTSLGFVTTISTTYEHPFHVARRLSTLDHLTNGRIGLNVVTSYIASAARYFGLSEPIAHDRRYAIADEFLSVCYKLWEASWEDGAVKFDVANNIHIDPARVHDINHQGDVFKVAGPHVCEPSPQRTPVIFQAGSSKAGRDFAARHAECVFVQGRTLAAVKENVAAIRRRAVDFGRAPQDILIFHQQTAIVAPTRAEAREQFEDYARYRSPESALAQYCGSSGYDLSALDPDAILTYTPTEANQSRAAQYTTQSDRSFRVWEVIDDVGRFGSGILVGTPIDIADRLESIVDETGLDGFNLNSIVTPTTIFEFVDQVIPELRNRGRIAERRSTFRETLFGKGRSHAINASRLAH
ncbi:LLM class flavin-dependent oxidoreductase [Phyllobacterium chamaecytisi]|uniref:LLM class flavin-dependent oxidoreductase n=1 Tax=Phyllobacterium chamaecytisi TaxID=2876082 RepID=UPI001CCB6DE7|nr:LLM class flavin-dependent oxidoreductase [Phyllobacterium sp. KW56]MBZ9603119.1 LLM class flavin-dependent oxidoreductase [Phyllobacterium sp. KW56]